MSILNNDIRYLKGVGPKRVLLLKKMNLHTIEDLIYYMPKSFEDRTKLNKLIDAKHGEKQVFKVTITEKPVIISTRKGLRILKVGVEDDSGKASLVWFNQDYIKQKIKLGQDYMVFGKVILNKFERQIQSPVIEAWETKHSVEKLYPVYGLTSGISNKIMANIIESALEQGLNDIKDILPYAIQNKYKFIEKKEAIYKLHHPRSINEYNSSRKQLAYEELLVMQLGLFRLKEKNIKSEGIKFSLNNNVDNFVKSLPYKLTNAQSIVLDEIMADMSQSKQMNRLVQGDVGSGKTIIAIVAMYNCVLNGYQATMMAPTEILAMQHYESLIEVFKGTSIVVRILTGKQSPKTKDILLKDLKSGKIDILVGTHALIQTGVEFYKLGLTVTDEQHRFGVKQRLNLVDKGLFPDILVMTATPIPRTLALILYGDLDISIIDELPPGRKDIKTYTVGNDMEERIYAFIEKQLLEGRQAYIVCPLIVENESLDIISVEQQYIRLEKYISSQYKIALMHGKLSQKEKDKIMVDFKANRIDILVSTTVIEVGVNIPNANIMLIQNADRFGLAQIHQLRGRVGRGHYQSYCVLVNNSMSKISRERMRVLESTSDGSIISEKDLELRGPGEFFGTLQHGLPELKFANLIQDMDILKIAQGDANFIIKNIYDNEYLNIRIKIKDLFSTIDSELIIN